MGVRSLPAFIWTLGITKLAGAHLNGFLLARGPSWPFVAILGCCKRFKKATTVVRLHLVIYHYHHSLASARYLEEKSWSQKKSNLQNTTLSKNKKKRGNTNSAFEQFAIVRRIRRLLREEVDDKRGDVSTKEHQHQ